MTSGSIVVTIVIGRFLGTSSIVAPVTPATVAPCITAPPAVLGAIAGHSLNIGCLSVAPYLLAVLISFSCSPWSRTTSAAGSSLSARPDGLAATAGTLIPPLLSLYPAPAPPGAGVLNSSTGWPNTDHKLPAYFSFCSLHSSCWSSSRSHRCPVLMTSTSRCQFLWP